MRKMKSVLIFVLFSALKVARAIPSAKAQWGPGFDDDDTTIDYFENEDDSCGVVWVSFFKPSKGSPMTPASEVTNYPGNA